MLVVRCVDPGRHTVVSRGGSPPVRFNVLRMATDRKTRKTTASVPAFIKKAAMRGDAIVGCGSYSNRLCQWRYARLAGRGVLPAQGREHDAAGEEPHLHSRTTDLPAVSGFPPADAARSVALGYNR